MGAMRHILFPVPSVLTCVLFPVWLLSLLPLLLSSPGRGGAHPPLYCVPFAGSALCCSGGPLPSSVPWMRAGGARCLVRVSPSILWLCTGSAHCQVPLPTPPPVAARINRAMLFGGPLSSSSSSGWPRADRSVTSSLSPSCQCPLSPWCHRGCLCSPGSPRWLGCPLALLAPVSCTCSALAHRTKA